MLGQSGALVWDWPCAVCVCPVALVEIESEGSKGCLFCDALIGAALVGGKPGSWKG